MSLPTQFIGPGRYRIAFSGSRGFTHRYVVDQAIHLLAPKVISVGDARGLDQMVRSICEVRGIPWTVHHCAWPEEGTKKDRWLAARERNGRVIEGADALIAFFASGERTPGTLDCINQALKAGIPVVVYHEGEWSREELS